MPFGSFHHSQFGGLLNKTTPELVASFRAYHRRVVEIDETKQFHDAYAYECARNDRTDYLKRLRDLELELNTRMQCDSYLNARKHGGMTAAGALLAYLDALTAAKVRIPSLRFPEVWPRGVDADYV